MYDNPVVATDKVLVIDLYNQLTKNKKHVTYNLVVYFK